MKTTTADCQKEISKCNLIDEKIKRGFRQDFCSRCDLVATRICLIARLRTQRKVFQRPHYALTRSLK